MRLTIIAFMLAALAAVAVLSTSAFNYAQLTPRTVQASIVTDNNGYLAVNSYDAQYACYVGFTNGKIHLTWDGGTSCTAGATGTGINAASTYYFHDVLQITNKGTKTLTHLWLNESDPKVTLNINTAAGAMSTSDTYAQSKVISTNLAPGQSWFVGFKIDASTLDTTASPLSTTLTIEARSTA